jgi:cytochrome bd ubiquinol oxidase subunit II
VFSLTIYRAASSEKTLGIMFLIALIGMPLVLTYTTIVYWTFRRRVEIGPAQLLSLGEKKLNTAV